MQLPGVGHLGEVVPGFADARRALGDHLPAIASWADRSAAVTCEPTRASCACTSAGRNATASSRIVGVFPVGRRARRRGG